MAVYESDFYDANSFKFKLTKQWSGSVIVCDLPTGSTSEWKKSSCDLPTTTQATTTQTAHPDKIYHETWENFDGWSHDNTMFIINNEFQYYPQWSKKGQNETVENGHFWSKNA